MTTRYRLFPRLIRLILISSVFIQIQSFSRDFRLRLAWNYTYYENSRNHIGNTMSQTKDGTLLISGYTTLDESGEYRGAIWLSRVRTDGEVMWEKNILHKKRTERDDGCLFRYVKDIIELESGDYLLAIELRYKKSIIIKVNSNGDPVLRKDCDLHYSGIDTNSSISGLVQIANDKNCLILTSSNRILIATIDDNLNQLNVASIETGNLPSVTSVQKNANGHVIFIAQSGLHNGIGQKSRDLKVIEFNPDENSITERLKIAGRDGALCITSRQNVIVSYDPESNFPRKDVKILMLDSDFCEQREITASGQGWFGISGFNLFEVSENNFTALGILDFKAWSLQLDGDGAILLEQEFSTPNLVRLEKVICADNCFYLLGITNRIDKNIGGSMGVMFTTNVSKFEGINQ